MRGRLIIAFFALCSCKGFEKEDNDTQSVQSNLLPSINDVRTIEGILSQDSCIGSIDSWFKEYGFQRRTSDRSIDQQEIIIWYTKAGGEIEAGRAIHQTSDDMAINDAPVDVFIGSYNIGRGVITVEHCGPNRSPEQAPRYLHIPTSRR